MYGVKVLDALIVNNVLSIGCEKIGEGIFKAGTTLTDGERLYEVTDIPFVKYETVAAMQKHICLTIKNDGIDEKDLEGKTLHVMQ